MLKDNPLLITSGKIASITKKWYRKFFRFEEIVREKEKISKITPTNITPVKTKTDSWRKVFPLPNYINKNSSNHVIKYSTAQFFKHCYYTTCLVAVYSYIIYIVRCGR